MTEKKDYKNKQLLYHVTALDNLESILQYGILSRFDLEKKSDIGKETQNKEEKLLKTDVANDEIIQKRRKLGILNSVPFHFFEPTPFTYCIRHEHPGTTFVAIAIKRDIAAKDEKVKVSTRHPLSPESKILSYAEGIEKVDWDAMGGDYNNEECKSTSMAECLFPSPVDPNFFYCIFVPDEESKNVVESLKESVNPSLPFWTSVFPNLLGKASKKEDLE